jgi:hypothetical protein
MVEITIKLQYHLWFPCCFSIYCTTISSINDRLNFQGIHLNARLNVNYEIHWHPWINVLNFKHAKFLARQTWPKFLTSINTFGVMKKFSCFVSILSPSKVNCLHAYVTYSMFHTQHCIFTHEINHVYAFSTNKHKSIIITRQWTKVSWIVGIIA